jgi:hypothetical protein
MESAWRTLGQMHLVGSRLYSLSLGPASEPVVVGAPRRRRQAVESPTVTVDLRALHDTVSYPEMEFLNGIFTRGFLGIISNLHRLEFLSGFLPSFFLSNDAIHE